MEKPVRQPVVAGTFYPDSKEELSLIIDQFLEKAEIPKIDKHIQGLIIPHAGYIYSGQVAAYGYKVLIVNPPAGGINKVILIGNSHQAYFDGISVYEKGYYQTPLGKVEIDEDLIKKIIKADKKISFQEQAHLQEHSLEVQLPFLQKVLDDFKIVPIIMGNDKPETIDILINALKGLIDDNTLVIASSDLSHYPKYGDAVKLDNEFIQAVLNRQELPGDVSDVQTRACGRGVIQVVMGLFKDSNIKLLKYANSGDTAGDKSQVVGYAAIVFTLLDSKHLTGFTSEKSEDELGKQKQKRLLEIARQSVETYIKQGKTIHPQEDSSFLNKHLGAFVTLKKHGQLRGCIGIFRPKIPLYQVVAKTAISSAVKDIRFTPVTKDELDELEYEISVLSPLKKVDSWKDIEIGKHGVQIKKGLRSGVFLPQVATENNWDLDTFMSILCQQKAGLSPDYWKDPDAEIYVFTAQVFGEEDVK